MNRGLPVRRHDTDGASRQPGPRSVLIVGGDGAIGAALTPELLRAGCDVTVTSRRPRTPPEHFLDMEADPAESPVLSRRFDAAVFCAGAASLRACRDQPGRTRQVNVTGPLAVARRLSERGTFPVLLSTNLVFDGLAPWPGEAAEPCPVVEYGRQKADAERGFLGLRHAAVVRLTKVLHAGTPLISQWLADLRCRRPVGAFHDMTAAPLDLSETVAALRAVVCGREEGIWHFSAPREHSYLDIARALAVAAGAPDSLVRPASARDPRQGLEHVPAHAALDTTLTSLRLGLTFSGLERLVRNLAAGVAPAQEAAR